MKFYLQVDLERMERRFRQFIGADSAKLQETGANRSVRN